MKPANPERENQLLRICSELSVICRQFTDAPGVMYHISHAQVHLQIACLLVGRAPEVPEVEPDVECAMSPMIGFL